MLATVLLAAAEHAEDVEASNPILPHWDEVFWGSVCFAIVFGILAWKAWPAIKKAIQDREDRVKADLERAEEAKNEAEASLADYQRQLAEARNEAGRIIEESRLAADQVRKDLIARAETEAAELRARAQDDIRLATDRALADLQSRVAELTIELAEKVVERNLDRDTQIALIESYINQVGSR
jgi:F-type H+-transporting ATPase subunit b